MGTRIFKKILFGKEKIQEPFFRNIFCWLVRYSSSKEKNKEPKKTGAT
jgi:hypothetical protein